jgi:copper(I)-binding protein
MILQVMRRSAVVLATTFLVACRPEPVGSVQVTDARAGATPPGATVAAVYMTITSTDADLLTGASTPMAAGVEMHTTIENGAVMQMRPLASVDLQPRKPFVFAPGGAHFMLTGLKSPLAADARFPLTLQFKMAGARTVEVEVAPPGEQ